MKKGGTVQTLECKRDGRTVWTKQVYIPAAEQEQAYSKFLCKRIGEFFYDFVGEIRAVSRKPSNVGKWND